MPVAGFILTLIVRRARSASGFLRSFSRHDRLFFLQGRNYYIFAPRTTERVGGLTAVRPNDYFPTARGRLKQPRHACAKPDL
jgi:hypothetical protein